MSSNDIGPCPQVGSIVHYIDYSAAHVAAMVLHVKGESCRKVWLRVFGINNKDGETYWVEQGDARGTWHWPEY